MPVGREKLMNEKECREIYREAFGEDGEFEERLFSLCGEYRRTASRDGKTVALLFALPCEIITPEKSFSAVYLYAAATKKAYRGQGYMSELIEALKKEGTPIFLKPANSGLVGFYEKLGFKRFSAITAGEEDKKAIPIGGFAHLAKTEKEFKSLGYSYTAMSYGMPTDPDRLLFPFIME